MKIQGTQAQENKQPVPVNFRQVEQRLEIARAAVERIWAPSPEEAQQTLRARALALAREPLPRAAAEESIEVVEFTLAYERYAIESHYIRQVAFLESLTPLPCTPAFVLGIVNLRGAIFPIIDLRKIFELPEGLHDLNKIIVLQSGKVLFGILADAIVGVQRILLTRLQASLPTLTGVRKHYLKGMTPERLVVLDAEKLLMDENIVVQEQVAE
jgi:purine-binding chemotaxis protein CheW